MRRWERKRRGAEKSGGGGKGGRRGVERVPGKRSDWGKGKGERNQRRQKSRGNGCKEGKN